MPIAIAIPPEDRDGKAAREAELLRKARCRG